MSLEEMLEEQIQGSRKLAQEGTALYLLANASQAIVVHSALPAQLVPTNMGILLVIANHVIISQQTLSIIFLHKPRLFVAMSVTSGKALMLTKNV